MAELESSDEDQGWRARFGRFLRSFSLRLNFYYAVLFITSATVLFTVFYWLLTVAIERRDREVLQAR